MSELTQPQEIAEDLPSVPDLTAVNPEIAPAYPYDIALLINNVVYSVFNVDGQQAAQFLSQPTFVQYANNKAKLGWTYDPETGKFSSPLTAQSE